MTDLTPENMAKVVCLTLSAITVILHKTSQGKKTYFWISDNSTVSRIAYDDVKNHLSSLLSRSSESERKLELVNGAVIQFTNVEQVELLRGITPDFIVFDQIGNVSQVETWNDQRGYFEKTTEIFYIYY